MTKLVLVSYKLLKNAILTPTRLTFPQHTLAPHPTPGFCDALGLGSSTKAAVIRRGLQETMDYCQLVAGDEFKVQ